MNQEIMKNEINNERNKKCYNHAKLPNVFSSDEPTVNPTGESIRYFIT